jgi:hypothetical protein
MLWRACAAASLTLALAFGDGTTRVVQAQAPNAQALLDAASNYVTAALPTLATLVATEEYVQERRVEPKTKRRLVSHPTEPQNWLLFRDVLEMDGGALPGHHDRLTRLFLNPTVENWMRVGEIAEASREFHLPGYNLDVTNPLVVVALVHPYYRPRMQFKLGKRDNDVGRNVWTLQFQEPEAKEVVEVNGGPVLRPLPPLLSRDLAGGTVWIESGTGRVLKTQLRVGDGLGAPTSVTTFRYDDTFKVAVPVEMKTTWTDGSGSRSTVTGTAKYTTWRRFSVETSIQGP